MQNPADASFGGELHVTGDTQMDVAADVCPTPIQSVIVHHPQFHTSESAGMNLPIPENEFMQNQTGTVGGPPTSQSSIVPIHQHPSSSLVPNSEFTTISCTLDIQCDSLKSGLFRRVIRGIQVPTFCIASRGDVLSIRIESLLHYLKSHTDGQEEFEDWTASVFGYSQQYDVATLRIPVTKIQNIEGLGTGLAEFGRLSTILARASPHPALDIPSNYEVISMLPTSKSGEVEAFIELWGPLISLRFNFIILLLKSSHQPVVHCPYNQLYSMPSGEIPPFADKSIASLPSHSSSSLAPWGSPSNLSRILAQFANTSVPSIQSHSSSSLG